MPNSSSRTLLVRSRDSVAADLDVQIAIGREIAARSIIAHSDLVAARADRSRWESYCQELLARSATTSELADQFRKAQLNRLQRRQAPLASQVQFFREGLDLKINALQDIKERLQLILEEATAQVPNHQSNKDRTEPSIFVVHGRDELAKNELARYLERLGLDAVILDEKPSQGLTIIEKFERYAATVDFAIVLLTPDDISTLKDAPDETREQARPNVFVRAGLLYGQTRTGQGRVVTKRAN
jgi:predicted nucleotide-binding protein